MPQRSVLAVISEETAVALLEAEKLIINAAPNMIKLFTRMFLAVFILSLFVG